MPSTTGRGTMDSSEGGYRGLGKVGVDGHSLYAGETIMTYLLVDRRFLYRLGLGRVTHARFLLLRHAEVGIRGRHLPPARSSVVRSYTYIRYPYTALYDRAHGTDGRGELALPACMRYVLWVECGHPYHTRYGERSVETTGDSTSSYVHIPGLPRRSDFMWGLPGW
ncbi:hypothetical protein C8Q77DRAFT_300268 [Trametes polyzona]|nr:hypothetical protein C8Q77DRAFT_300268 [Trametes polyzona]